MDPLRCHRKYTVHLVDFIALISDNLLNYVGYCWLVLLNGYLPTLVQITELWAG